MALKIWVVREKGELIRAFQVEDKAIKFAEEQGATADVVGVDLVSGFTESRCIEGPGGSFYIIGRDAVWVKVDPVSPQSFHTGIYPGRDAWEVAASFRRCAALIERGY